MTTIRPVLLTADLERLRAFYVGLLGAEETVRMPEQGPTSYLGLALHGSEFGLAADASVPAGTPGRVLLSVEVDDVDALLPRVGELGGRITGGPSDMPWGQRVLHLQDPDGNLVNLAQPLPGAAGAR